MAMQADKRAAAAAVFGREGEGEEPQLAQELEHVLRILGGAVDLLRPRRDFFARHAPHQLLDGQLLLA